MPERRLLGGWTFKKQNAPATPGAGELSLAARKDGKVTTKDEDGTETPLRWDVNDRLEGVPLFLYGDSWTAYDSASYNAKWWQRLAARNKVGAITNRAVSGSTMADISAGIIGVGKSGLNNPWIPGTTGLVFINAGINELNLLDGTLTRIQNGLTDGLRSTLRFLGAGTIADVGTTESGTWVGPISLPRAHLGTYRTSSVLASYVEYAFTGTEVWAMVHEFAVANFNGMAIEAKIDGGAVLSTTITHDRILNTHYTAGSAPRMIEVSGLTNAAHTLRLTSSAANGAPSYFAYDMFMLPSATPPQVVVLKAPMLGATVQAERDAVSAAIDAACAGIPYVRVVDLNQTGWDPATMLVVDGVHPNDRGNAFIAGVVDESLRRLDWSTSMHSVIGPNPVTKTSEFAAATKWGVD